LQRAPHNQSFLPNARNRVRHGGVNLLTFGTVSKLIHSPATLSKTILDGLRKKSTQELIESLRPGLQEALRVKPDGRVMNGNHRLTVLMERGVDVNALPREVVP